MTTPATTARAEILASIRAHLAASAPADARTHDELPVPAPPRRGALPLYVDPLSPPPPPFAEQLSPRARFLERARAVGVHCHEVSSDDEARAAVARILAASDVKRVGVSDAQVLVPLRGVGGAVNAEDLSHDALFACEAGVTAAQLGIAETGTIGLLSAVEKHRLLSLVPPLHVAVLRASDIKETLAEALMHVRGDGEITSHAITFITGPSRTSDIELTLAIGVHGPQALHVIVILSAPLSS